MSYYILALYTDEQSEQNKIIKMPFTIRAR